MAEHLLQQILNELKEIKSEQRSMKHDLDLVKSQLTENTNLTRAIFDRQEETDAKLEALTMDVHNLHVEVTDIKTRLAFNTYKITENELEIFKLKRQ